MKICLTAITNNLDSQLDPKFGRCVYFIIIDSQTMKFKALKNKAATVSEGAGVLAAQILVDQEVKHVITGNIGPRSMQALKTAGIEVNIERDITVKDAIEKFRSKTLRKTITPTVCGYSISSSQDQGGGLWRV